MHEIVVISDTVPSILLNLINRKIIKFTLKMLFYVFSFICLLSGGIKEVGKTCRDARDARKGRPSVAAARVSPRTL